MNARLKNINEIESLVKGVGMMEHTFENFNDGLTMMLVENKLQLNEGFWGDAWDGFKGFFHTSMDVIQGAAAVVSLGAYSSVIGAPIGLAASIVDAAIDVGYAIGNTVEAVVDHASGNHDAAKKNWGQAASRLAWAGVGLIPIAGDAATIARVGAKTVKTIDTVNDVRKVVKLADASTDGAKLIAKLGKVGDITDGTKDVVRMITKTDDITDAFKALSKMDVKALTNATSELGNVSLKQIDNIKGISKIGNVEDATKVIKSSGRHINTAADVIHTSANQTKHNKFFLNVIDRMGNSKFLNKGTFGLTGKFANFSDNFKLANASFASLDNGKQFAKFSTGGLSHFDYDAAGDVAKKMFGTGIWGGGKTSSKLMRNVNPDLYKSLRGLTPIAADNANIFNKIGTGGRKLYNRLSFKYTRSMLFPTGDLYKNLGRSSNLLQASTDITKRASHVVNNAHSFKYVQKGEKAFNVLGDLKKAFTPSFAKIASSRPLRVINKVNKWNKTPQFTELWKGRIDTYDEFKNKTGIGDRRTLSQLGTDKYFGLLDPTNFGGVNISKINPLASDQSVRTGVTPEKWLPGIQLDIGKDKYETDYNNWLKSQQDKEKAQQDTIDTDADTQSQDALRQLQKLRLQQQNSE